MYHSLMFYTQPIPCLKHLKEIVDIKHETKYIFNILEIFIVPELKKMGYDVYFIPQTLSKSSNYFYYNIDYPFDYLKTIYNKDFFHHPNLLAFCFYMTYDATEICITEPINIMYNSDFVDNKDKKIKLIDIFEQNLFGYYDWNGSTNMNMRIYYKKITSIPIPKEQLLSNDEYPYLVIEIICDDSSYLDEISKYLFDISISHHRWDDRFTRDSIYFQINVVSCDSSLIEIIKKYVLTMDKIKETKISYRINKDDNENCIWDYKRMYLK